MIQALVSYQRGVKKKKESERMGALVCTWGWGWILLLLQWKTFGGSVV